MAKRGPKPKLAEARQQKRIFEVLSLGGSLQDAADLLGIDRSTLTRRKQTDAEFAQGIKKATVEGKLVHLKNVKARSPRWQASAWFLERRWGNQFGRRDRVNTDGTLQVTGAGGGPVQTETTLAFDHDVYRELYRQQRGQAPLNGGTATSADRN
jgi:transposase